MSKQGRIDYGEWVFGGLRQTLSGRCFITIPQVDGSYWSVDVDVEPATVGQFTGKKDGGGNDIYEGDLLKGKWGRPVSKNGELTSIYFFLEKIATVSFGDLGWGYDPIVEEKTAPIYPYEWEDLVIVGNIHEKPKA